MELPVDGKIEIGHASLYVILLPLPFSKMILTLKEVRLLRIMKEKAKSHSTFFCLSLENNPIKVWGIVQ